MGEFAIGQSVLRREDPRLLRGHGRFFDDLKLADQLRAASIFATASGRNKSFELNPVELSSTACSRWLGD